MTFTDLGPFPEPMEVKMGVILKIEPKNRVRLQFDWSRGRRMGWLSVLWILRTIAWWRDRARQRRHLAKLDDRMLRDIGLTRLDVAAECRKLPWQP